MRRMNKIKPDYWFAIFIGSFMGSGVFQLIMGKWGYALTSWAISLAIFVAYSVWLNKDNPL